MAWPRSASEEPFRLGGSNYGATRGDESAMVFTRLPVDAPDFRARAEAWVAPRHPRFSVNVEDMAIMFTRSLDAAKRFDPAQAAITLCLYEDGTPPVWLPGAGDCFSDHQSFSERLNQAVTERPKDEHPDLRHYFGARKACAGVTPPPTNTGPRTEIASAQFCGSLERTREKLLQKFPNELQLEKK